MISSILYDRTISVTRAGAALVSGVTAGIKIEARGNTRGYMSDDLAQNLAYILPDPMALVTQLAMGDFITDDLGRNFRALEVYPTPLGQEIGAMSYAVLGRTVIYRPYTLTGRDTLREVDGTAAANADITLDPVPFIAQVSQEALQAAGGFLAQGDLVLVIPRTTPNVTEAMMRNAREGIASDAAAVVWGVGLGTGTTVETYRTMRLEPVPKAWVVTVRALRQVFV